MSTVAGVFSETTLQNVRMRAKEMLFDDRIKQDYIPNIDAFKFIKKLQTANIKPLAVKDKDYEVEAEWLNACELEITECSSCDFNGTELSTNTQKYKLNQCAEVGFAIDEKTLLTNDYNFEELLAKGFLKADRILSEGISQLGIAYLNVFAGVNQLGTEGQKTVIGNVTTVPPAYWNAEFIAYITRVGIINKFSTPEVLSGKLLFDASTIAMYNQPNADGKGQNAMFNAMKLNFDLFNIDLINEGDLYAYLVSRGAMAFGSKSYYQPNVIKEYFEQKRWGMNSEFLEGVTYDVHYTNKCVDGDFFRHEYKVRVKCDYLLNPLGCNSDNTGVLAFLCQNYS